MTNPRTARRERRTSETSVVVEINLDGGGTCTTRTGLGLLDHMLDALARHARFDLTVECDGDLRVDDHHSVEDVALSLGACVSDALGERAGIRRFGSAYAPLDESLARVVIDLSGRPGSVVNLGLRRERIGDVATENIAHFFSSLAIGGALTLHADVLRGENDHHRAEAAFKALALALRAACARDGSASVPSTKGTLT